MTGCWRVCVIKVFLRKVKRLIAKPVLRLKFLCSNRLKQLKKYDGARIILMDVPTHSNLGDRAISEAEIQYINANIRDKKLCVFTHMDCLCYGKIISKYVKKEDIILVQGGGFIGSLWEREHKVVLSLLKNYYQHKMVILPQTIYFYKEDRKLKEQFVAVANNCKNLTIIVREKKSYDFLVENNVQCNKLLTPDMVLNIYYENKSNKRNGKILICSRKDKEKTQDFNEIFKSLTKAGYSFDFTDTICEGKIIDGKKAVYEKLNEFSKYSLVITDRLHAMIFSTVTGTACIAFDNLSKKVSGVYDWIKHLDYIKCIEIKDFDMDLVKTLFSLKQYEYDRKQFEQYFKMIKDILIK